MAKILGQLKPSKLNIGKNNVIWIVTKLNFSVIKILLNDFIAFRLPAYDIKFHWCYRIFVGVTKFLQQTKHQLIFVGVIIIWFDLREQQTNIRLAFFTKIFFYKYSSLRCPLYELSQTNPINTSYLHHFATSFDVLKILLGVFLSYLITSSTSLICVHQAKV